MSVDTNVATTNQSKYFETLRRDIAVAAREQGDNTDKNFRLRYAIERAHQANMPDEAIERARHMGAAGEDAPDYQELTYEGYGPDGVAVMVEAITDDPKRTAAELGELFDAHHGNLGDTGAVSWQFERRGVIRVAVGQVDDDDQFMLEVIEMGATDLGEPLYGPDDPDHVSAWRVFCAPTDVRQVYQRLEDADYAVCDARVTYDATQRVALSADRTRNFLSFFEKLTSLADVQDAYANWEVA